MAEFERLGWAATIDSRHDTGLDLYLRPRDQRRFELGVVMGAQVKTGPAYFKSEKKDTLGNVAGWWFYDPDRTHIDYWLGHALPHLLILRDQSLSVSYWALVAPDSVVNTGKGGKILVPRSNTVDEAHLEALVQAAMSRTPGLELEGSTWRRAEIVPKDRVRYALLAPRLVAPHPNTQPTNLDALEALASTILLRQPSERFFAAEDDRFRNNGTWITPSLASAQEEGTWDWRAAAAVHTWLYRGDSSSIKELCVSAVDSREAGAAIAILKAAVHRQEGDPAATLADLQSIWEEDELEPAYQAWVLTHRASALLELGAAEEAIDLALEVVRARQQAPTDATLGALASSATEIIFQASGPRSLLSDEGGGRTVGIGEVISSGDTATGWWWSQLLSWALPSELDALFREWAPDGSVRFGASDAVALRLTSAETLGLLAAHDGDWHLATNLLAKHLLVRTGPNSPSRDVAGHLWRLRMSGDASDAKQACKHLLSHGPVDAIRTWVSHIDPSVSTRSTALVDLGILTAAADVLEPHRADYIAGWAIDTLSVEAHDYIDRTRPTFDVWGRLIRLLAALAHVCQLDVQQRIARLLLDSAPEADGVKDQELARLARAVPTAAWQSELEAEALMLAQGSTHVARAMQRSVGHTDAGIREQLINEACAGNIRALEGLDDVRDLPEAAVEGLVSTLVRQVEQMGANAREGMTTMGGTDELAALILLNIWHPSLAQREPVLDSFENTALSPMKLENALEILAFRADAVPGHLRERVIAACMAIAWRAESSCNSDDVDIRGGALELIQALGGDVDLADAVSGDPTHRRAAAAILGRATEPSALPLLVALCRDPNPEVRNSAAAGLVRRAIGLERESAIVVRHVQRMLNAEGLAMAHHVARALYSARPVHDGLRPLLDFMVVHPSAYIRAAFQDEVEA